MSRALTIFNAVLDRISREERWASPMRIVIVGDRGSGKVTFLGLLYATQVKFGSDKMDRFRFHTSPESLEEIGVVFEQLMSGSFPEAVTKQTINGISFQVGYRRGRAWDSGSFSTLHFNLATQVEEFSRLLMAGSVVDQTWKTVYDADAAIILVDSAKLAAKAEDSPMVTYDAAVESLLTAIQQLRQPGGRRILQPIFIFSKFDRVSPEVLRAAKVATTPPPAGKTGARAGYAEPLLDANLPRTLARVKSREKGRMRLERPMYFFSWVHTEPTAPGQPARIRLRRDELAGWEPDFSRDEYLALLEYLGEISLRTGE